jgi:hypothetical protein
MVRAPTFGKMVKFLKENGFKEVNMDSEYGKVERETPTWENGKIIK